LGKFASTSGELPLLGKTYRESFGTFPYWGNLASTFFEQSPIGENQPEVFWNNPQ